MIPKRAHMHERQSFRYVRCFFFLVRALLILVKSWNPSRRQERPICLCRRPRSSVVVGRRIHAGGSFLLPRGLDFQAVHRLGFGGDDDGAG
jgi:hypothetical protein